MSGKAMTVCLLIEDVQHQEQTLKLMDCMGIGQQILI